VRRYLLDTGPLTAYLLGLPTALTRVTPWISDLEAATSMLCYGEIVEYLAGLKDVRRHRRDLRGALRLIHPYPLGLRTLERYAFPRRQRRPPYGPGLIGDIDTLIAATALEYGLTLLTGDRDFERVSDLDLMLLPLMR
jgi:predicted nucleic acid-binding protein